MSKETFEKPIKGIDQLSNETSLQEGTVRSSSNVVFDKDGNFGMRPGYIQRVVGEGYHSFYSSKRGWLIVCAKNVINGFNPETFELAPLAVMNTSNLTSFTELNGNIYYMNVGSSGVFKSGDTSAKPLGIELPPLTPQFAAIATGSLFPGSYGVTYTIIAPDGEESGTGPLITIDLPDGGGIIGTLFSVLSGYKFRIYMTTADGEELYQAAEFDADVASYSIDSHEQGRQPGTMHLEPLPYGYIIRDQGSRLFVATKEGVVYSDAFRPHLCNLAHNFLPIVGFPHMMESLDEGLFVSDDTGVTFYQGKDPSSYAVMKASNEVAIFGTSIVLSTKQFSGEEFQQYDRVVIWLSSSGYQVGLPTGEVVSLHKEQVDLPQYIQGSSAYFTIDGVKQVVTPVSSNQLGSTSIALDSNVIN
jgi:hypothetical protein